MLQVLLILLLLGHEIVDAGRRAVMMKVVVVWFPKGSRQVSLAHWNRQFICREAIGFCYSISKKHLMDFLLEKAAGFYILWSEKNFCLMLHVERDKLSDVVCLIFSGEYHHIILKFFLFSSSRFCRFHLLSYTL